VTEHHRVADALSRHHAGFTRVTEKIVTSDSAMPAIVAGMAYGNG